MSTFNQALLASVAGNIGAASYTKIANIQEGGQLGAGPRILQLDAATPLIFNPAIIVLLSAPTMWSNNAVAKKTLKALFELHAKSVSGIGFGYTLNFAESLVGHDGQNMSMPTNSQRTAVNPSFTWVEGPGQIVWNLHYKWITDIQHPDTQVSRLSATLNANTIPAWLLSTVSASFMAIQPDPTGLPDRIIDAAVYTGVIPTETGDNGMKRDINSAEAPERTISYRAIVQHNDNTRELGRIVMQSLNAHKPDFQRATTYSGIESSISDLGMSKEVEDALRDYQLLT